MQKIRVDFGAHTSVVVAINDDDPDDLAVEKAQEYLDRKDSYTGWDFDNNIDSVSDDEDVVNHTEVETCEFCGRQYVDTNSELMCPYCHNHEKEEE